MQMWLNQYILFVQLIIMFHNVSHFHRYCPSIVLHRVLIIHWASNFPRAFYTFLWALNFPWACHIILWLLSSKILQSIINFLLFFPHSSLLLIRKLLLSPSNLLLFDPNFFILFGFFNFSFIQSPLLFRNFKNFI